MRLAHMRAEHPQKKQRFSPWHAFRQSGVPLAWSDLSASRKRVPMNSIHAVAGTCRANRSAISFQCGRSRPSQGNYSHPAGIRRHALRCAAARGQLYSFPFEDYTLHRRPASFKPPNILAIARDSLLAIRAHRVHLGLVWLLSARCPCSLELRFPASDHVLSSMSHG